MKTAVEWVKLGEDGRIVIPANLRAALGIAPGQMVALQLDGCELRIFSVSEGFKKIQAIAARFPRTAESSVDDFIAERRAEAALE